MTGKSEVEVAIPAVLDAVEVRCRSVCLASGLSPLSLCLSVLTPGSLASESSEITMGPLHLRDIKQTKKTLTLEEN